MKLDYLTGTMIELPRAALRAGEIAETAAEFFSFGTNDLTQTCFGLSRDDAGSFLGDWPGSRWACSRSFVSIDRDGVGELMKTGSSGGLRTRQVEARHLRRTWRHPASPCQEVGWITFRALSRRSRGCRGVGAALDKEHVATTA